MLGDAAQGRGRGLGKRERRHAVSAVVAQAAVSDAEDARDDRLRRMVRVRSDDDVGDVLQAGGHSRRGHHEARKVDCVVGEHATERAVVVRGLGPEREVYRLRDRRALAEDRGEVSAVSACLAIRKPARTSAPSARARTPWALERTTRIAGGQWLAVEHPGDVERLRHSFTGITPVCRNRASTRSESPPPVFTATIGFVFETRPASLVNLRGLPNDAMCNAMTDVALVSLPVLEEVVRAHVRLVPERDEVRDADTRPMSLLEQRHAEWPRLAGENATLPGMRVTGA